MASKKLQESMDQAEQAKIAFGEAVVRLRVHFMALMVDALRRKDVEFLTNLVQSCPDNETIVMIDEALYMLKQGMLEDGSAEIHASSINEEIVSDYERKQSAYITTKNDLRKAALKSWVSL